MMIFDISFILVLFFSYSFGFEDLLSNFESQYDVNTLSDPGSLHPFGGKLPNGRVFHSISLSSNYIFVYGGYSPNLTTLGDLNLYHIPSQRWSSPIDRLECCNDVKETVNIIGKTNNVDLPFLKSGSQGDSPLTRAEHASCVLNDEFYIFGGYNEQYQYLNDMYKFSVEKIQWIPVDNYNGFRVPKNRAGHSLHCNATNGLIYLFGGRGTSHFTNQTIGYHDIWVYDSHLNLWDKIEPHSASPVISSRQHAATCLLNHTLLVYGGMDPSNGYIYNDIWRFNFTSLYWSKLFPVTNDILSYSYSPPPMYRAHLIPMQSNGFFIYGGVASGGSCAWKECGATQTSIGQLFYFVFQNQTWIEPLSDDNLLIYQTSPWVFARLDAASNDVSSSIRSYDEKYLKDYLWEEVVYDVDSHLLYEFGGVQPNDETMVRDDQSYQYEVIDQVYVTNITEPTLLDVGGFIQTTYSDTFTNEYQQTNVKLPSNSFWSIQDTNANQLTYKSCLRYYSFYNNQITFLSETCL